MSRFVGALASLKIAQIAATGDVSFFRGGDNASDLYTSISVSHCEGSTVPSKKQSLIREAIVPYKAKEKQLRQQWEDDEEGFRKLPARAWPPFQPDSDKLEGLQMLFEECTAQGEDNCDQKAFDLATCYVFNNLDPNKGLALYKQLADREMGHPDATVAAGVVLVEGLGVPIDEQAGLKYLQKEAAMRTPQGSYELGTLYYTGVLNDGDDGGDARAFRYFQKSASSGHIGGMYMVAEMILNDETPEAAAPATAAAAAEDGVKQAVELFARAAEQGHRSARQRMREFFSASA
jgi:hypothetical protein